MFTAPLSPPKMTEVERLKISQFVESEFGIKMPANKKTLLEGRLSKRLVDCGMGSFGEYFHFVLHDPAGQDEFLRFADLVSTHETSFFREAGHFDYLRTRVLPDLEPGRSLEVLSAACSTGEEVYTLAMVLDGAGVDFTVEGVDLSDRAVAIARRGVYLGDRTKGVAPELRQRYLMRAKDRRNNLCRVVPELRAKTRFHTGNLLGDPGLTRNAYDLIFCRNVLIYFEPPNQRKVIQSLLARLRSGGLLFLGHSETMLSLGLPIRTMAHAVYQKA